MASSSSVAARSSKYTYRSAGGGSADINIEYSADLSALTRLEVKITKWFSVEQNRPIFGWLAIFMRDHAVIFMEMEMFQKQK